MPRESKPTKTGCTLGSGWMTRGRDERRKRSDAKPRPATAAGRCTAFPWVSRTSSTWPACPPRRLAAAGQPSGNGRRPAGCGLAACGGDHSGQDRHRRVRLFRSLADAKPLGSGVAAHPRRFKQRIGRGGGDGDVLRRWARRPAARWCGPRRTAASPRASPASACSRGKASYRSVTTWIIPARWPDRWPTWRSCSAACWQKRGQAPCQAPISRGLRQSVRRRSPFLCRRAELRKIQRCRHGWGFWKDSSTTAPILPFAN